MTKHNLFLIAMITLHGPTGLKIIINPDLVTSLQEARPAGTTDKLLTDEVRCMVNLADGKRVSVVEDCSVVRQLIERGKQ